MDFRRYGKRIGLFFGFFLLAAEFLAGCSRKMPVQAENQEVITADYTYGQLMVVAATERNRYQNVYTGQLWAVALDGGGGTFETKLKEQIERFLLELETINVMAVEREVSLTGQEQDTVKALAQEYFDSLSKGDRDYMQVSQEEVEDLYLKYYLADKLVTSLTEGENLEVSDAEAKVIQILQIELDTREEAEAVLEQVSQEKADFAAIASKNSRNSQTELALEWTENLGPLEQSAFDLEQDEISDILERNGKFYIQKCVNAYDQEATANRKNRLIQGKKSRAFKAIYEPYAADHKVTLAEGIWERVDFSGGQDCTSDDFFQRYHSRFGG